MCKFSPHAWGWSLVKILPGRANAIFPTRVGMVRPPDWAWLTYKNFPHTRGDGPIYCRASGDGILFSPHAWGWSAASEAASATYNIFPTRVGMVLRRHDPDARHYDFPHTRGDGPPPLRSPPGMRPFSPHAWGWSCIVLRSLLEQIIFPTRVGMVRARAFIPPPSFDFPHTRGDGPKRREGIFQGKIFSPHAWGWSEVFPR